MVVTEEGMVTAVNPLHSKNAMKPIDETDNGMLYVPVKNVVACINIDLFLLNNSPSALE